MEPPNQGRSGLRFQDQVVKLTSRALDDVCEAALQIPADKRTWKAGGSARSVLEQMQEIATTPLIFEPIFGGKGPEGIQMDRKMGTLRELAAGLDTVEKCIEAARIACAAMTQAIEAMPDEKLDQELLLPIGPGEKVTYADALMMPRWNMIYHLGQITFIQLMLEKPEQA